MSSIKYLMRSVLILFIAGSVLILTAHAQENPKKLSLNEAISTALTNNKDIHLAMLDERIAVSNYQQTNAIFLPQVGVSYTAIGTNNPLNAFGFKLQQRTITQSDFNPDRLNHPSETPDYMAKLEVQQPLVNVDMLYQRMGAKKQTEVYQYKMERAREYLTFQVQKAYLQLQLAYSVVTVLEEALQTTQSVYTYTDNYFKQGLIQKSDVLNAQVQVATLTSNLAKANSNVHNTSGYLRLLMGDSTGGVYKTDTITIELKNTPFPKNIELSRADFIAMQKGIEASDLMIRSNQMSYLPKLNAFGAYQYNDSRLMGFGENSYLVGVQLSWNVFNGNRTRNTIATRKLERNKMVIQLALQKDQSQLELDKAYRDLDDAMSEIEQGKIAVEQASEALRILQNRYQKGLVNTTDVLMAQTQLAQHKFSLAQAYFTASLTQAYLQFLTTHTNN